MNKLVAAGSVYSEAFTVTDANNAAVDADSLPTGVLYRNSVATAVTVTVTQTGTGAYTASATVPGGYAAGDTLQFLVSAFVSFDPFSVWLSPAFVGPDPVLTAGAADKVLGRSLAGGADGGRTVRQAMAAARNRVAFDVPAVGQFTVFSEDDTTPLFTGTYARGATTSGPLTATDPAA